MENVHGNNHISMIKIKGINEVISELKKSTGDIKAKGEKAIVKWAYAVEGEAKELAPADETRLRSSISAKVENGNNEITASVVVQANYAAYIEFGTKKYAAKYVASLPSEWKDYAATFKGKGDGNLDEFIQSIMAWVRRKGIGATRTKSGGVSSSRSSLDAQQQAAYNIALHILQNGIKPKPFLYPAVRDNTKKLFDDLNKLA